MTLSNDETTVVEDEEEEDDDDEAREGVPNHLASKMLFSYV